MINAKNARERSMLSGSGEIIREIDTKILFISRQGGYSFTYQNSTISNYEMKTLGEYLMSFGYNVEYLTSNCTRNNSNTVLKITW